MGPLPNLEALGQNPFKTLNDHGFYEISPAVVSEILSLAFYTHEQFVKCNQK